MSKPWRMVALQLGAWLGYALFRWNNGDTQIAMFRPLEWSCLVVIIGGIQTGTQRLGRILRALKTKNEDA